MKKLFLPLVMLILVVNVHPVQSSLDMNKATFSSDLEVDTEYSWNIENYLYKDNRVDTRSSPNEFSFIHGSRIELEIEKDPTELSLTANEDLSDVTNISNYFTLEYDNRLYDFDKADQLYIWIFPVSGTNTDGERVNLITEFYVHNLYNLLRNGESLNFTSQLPDATISADTDDEETVVNYQIESAEMQVRVDDSTGVLNAVNFVSDSPNFRIEIDRRGGGSGALPISPVWTLIPLLAIPITIRYLKDRS